MNEIKQALHNLKIQENNNNNITELQIKYYQGMFLMAVCSTMQYEKIDFLIAFNKILDLLPKDHLQLKYFIPTQWLDHVRII